MEAIFKVLLALWIISFATARWTNLFRLLIFAVAAFIMVGVARSALGWFELNKENAEIMSMIALGLAILAVWLIDVMKTAKLWELNRRLFSILNDMRILEKLERIGISTTRYWPSPLMSLIYFLIVMFLPWKGPKICYDVARTIAPLTEHARCGAITIYTDHGLTIEKRFVFSDKQTRVFKETEDKLMKAYADKSFACGECTKHGGRVIAGLGPLTAPNEIGARYMCPYCLTWWDRKWQVPVISVPPRY